MLPILEGTIRRRILLNFRVDPDLVQALLPSSLEPITKNGAAIVGICLIGLQNLRPKGLPSMMGLSSENMAHRVAVRYPAGDGKKDGVFIWRRETDQCLVSLLGGRLFPGVHEQADFAISEGQAGLSMKVSTRKGEADVGFQADYETEWKPTAAFSSFQDAREFFERGDCGFSCSLQNGRLDGMRLQMSRWEM